MTRWMSVASATVIATGMCVQHPAWTRAAGADSELLAEAQNFFKPLPQDMATPEFPITPERVSLGRKLFFDPRISADGTVGCSRCHQPALYGTDALPKSRGAFDKLNPRRAPTVLNAALSIQGSLARRP